MKTAKEVFKDWVVAKSIELKEPFTEYELNSLLEDFEKDKFADSYIEFAKQHVAKALVDLYEQIKHGDEEHQKWLKEFFDNYSLDNIK